MLYDSYNYIMILEGGDEIKRDCREYRLELNDGDIFVSSPGKLHCTIVIHAIGPDWRGGWNGEANSLAECVRKSMFEASSRKLRSIAFPAISSGCKCYPVDHATCVILDTIYSYLDEDLSTSLKDVFLVDTDDDAMSCFKKKLCLIKGTSKSDHHGMSSLLVNCVYSS